MKFKHLQNKKWFRVLSNKYVIILTAFLVWMLFLDSNSWLVHHELNNQISDLNNSKEYYAEQIAKDNSILEKLNDSIELEKFARQEYFMKRENEEIFIIEYADSLEWF